MKKSASFLQITCVIFLMLFVTNITAKTVSEDFNPPQNLTFSISGYNVLLQWDEPESSATTTLINYIIEKNGVLIDYCETLYYLDQNVDPGTYEYCVIANYENGESEPICISVTVEDNPVFGIPFTENFSEEELPMGWENIDNNVSGATWSFDNPNSRTISGANFDNSFAIFDSDYWGGSISGDATLLSPKIDCSSATSVQLSFSNQFRSGFGSSGTVEVTVDGGSSWNEIAHYESENVGFPNPAITTEYNISEFAAEESEVQIRWQYIGSDAYWWAIDNIKITIPTSPWNNPPKQFTAQQSSEDVILNWEPPSTGGAWVHYDDGINDHGINAGTDPFYCAALWPAGTLNPFDGLPITDITFFNFGADNEAEYTIYIWEDDAVVCNQTVDNIAYNSWNEIALTTDITIDSEKTYRVGYLVENYESGSHPAGLDTEVSYPGLSNLISLDGILFEDLLETYGFNGDWNLQFFVDNDGKKESVNRVLADNRTFKSGGELNIIDAEKRISFISQKSASLTGYNVYKEDILIANTIQTTNFTDLSAEVGTLNYCVEAVYNDGVSSSVCVNIDVIEVPPVPSMETSFVCSSVTVFWITPSIEPTSYFIYRDDVFLDEIFGNNYTDEEFLEGTHTYCVAANYEGIESIKVCQDILSETPFPAENLETSVYGANAINLTWEPPSGKTSPSAEITEYIILRDEEVIHSTEETSYTDVDVEASILYCYTIITHYENGCFSLSSNEACEEIPDNIYTVEGDSDIEIFPNPAKDNLYIKTDNEINKISVFNNLGQIIQSGNKTTIDISNLEAGYYLLKIEMENKTVTKQFMVR